MSFEDKLLQIKEYEIDLRELWLEMDDCEKHSSRWQGLEGRAQAKLGRIDNIIQSVTGGPTVSQDDCRDSYQARHGGAYWLTSSAGTLMGTHS